MQMNQKRLAAYLAKVRGPDSVVKIPERPRPTGEAARVVWTLYDVERVPDASYRSLPAADAVADNDGTNWALGTPSKGGLIIHDDMMDFDGNLWFTSNSANSLVTVGKVEPATGKITVYPTPENMQPLGGAVTVDVDGKGMIWASAPAGVLRFNPQTLEFTEYKTTQYRRPQGVGGTYGAAGDRDGNGWWAEMAWDTIGKADGVTGKVTEIVLPENRRIRDFLTPQEVEAYGKVTDISTGNPYPWAQGPRRMGTDKNADVLWVGDSWGASLARIDTKTNEVKMIPVPDKAMQPYHIHVDSKHNVWGNLWTNDQIFRYDPAANKWATFELPVRGTEMRHLSIDERSGVLKVSMPVYRTNQMAIMTIRSEADIAALKQQASN
jgi:streptogramin lyase